MNTNRWLAVVVVLQVMVLLSLWLGGPSLPPAQAQVPDAGAQRLAMIEELRALNAKMDKTVTILSSGELQVRIVNPDDLKGGK